MSSCLDASDRFNMVAASVEMLSAEVADLKRRLADLHSRFESHYHDVDEDGESSLPISDLDELMEEVM